MAIARRPSVSRGPTAAAVATTERPLPRRMWRLHPLGPLRQRSLADLMCGPNLPLTKAFLWCGWRTISVDWLLDPAHDLSNPLRQKSLAGQLEEIDFIAAAMDWLPGLSVNAACGSMLTQLQKHKEGGLRAGEPMEELALVPPPGAGDDGVRTVERHAVFRMRVCGGPEQTPVPQTQRPGDRGVAAFDVPSYSPPPRVGTTGEFRWQVVPV